MPRGIRARIENAFERYGRAVARRPWIAIASCALLALGLAAYVPLLEFDTSTEQMLKPNDPIRLRYEAFREQFGRDELIAVGIAGPRASSMQNLAAFGLLTGLAFLSALVVELLVTPALLVTAAVGGVRARAAS